MHTWKCFINRHGRETAEEIGGVVLELSEQFLLHHQTATIDDGGKNCGGSLRGGVRVGVLERRLAIKLNMGSLVVPTLMTDHNK